MAWTYLPGGVSARDRVRLAIGDTDFADQRLLDEEIDVALADCSSDVMLASLDCCVNLQGKYAGLVNETQAGLTENWDQLVRHYAVLETTIRALMVRKGHTGVYLGGKTETDKQLTQMDTDRVQPAFARAKRLAPFDRLVSLP